MKNIKEYIVELSNGTSIDFSITNFYKSLETESSLLAHNSENRVEFIKKFIAYCHFNDSWDKIEDLILNQPHKKFYNELRFTIIIFLIDLYPIAKFDKNRVMIMLKSYLLSVKNSASSAPLEAAYFFSWKIHGIEAEKILLDVISNGKTRFGRNAAIYGLFEYYKERNELMKNKNIFKKIAKEDKSELVRFSAEMYYERCNKRG